MKKKVRLGIMAVLAIVMVALLLLPIASYIFVP